MSTPAASPSTVRSARYVKPKTKAATTSTSAVSWPQILNDSKNLAEKLINTDGQTHSALAATQDLDAEAKIMKQYHEFIEELNALETSSPSAAASRNLKSREALLAEIKGEDRLTCMLQKENYELHNMVREQQATMDLIMTNYRKQVDELKTCQSVERKLNKFFIAERNKMFQESVEKMNKATTVMKKAIKLDDATSAKFSELIVRLQCENEGLREMLQISTVMNGNGAPGGCAVAAEGEKKTYEDKEVQTDGGDEEELEKEKEFFSLNNTTNSSWDRDEGNNNNNENDEFVTINLNEDDDGGNEGVGDEVEIKDKKKEDEEEEESEEAEEKVEQDKNSSQTQD